MNNPETALDTYKAIIDKLVNETRLRGGGANVRKASIYSKAPAKERYNRFIQTLSEDQKTLLADMLQDERDGTIHDVLAELTWWMNTRDVGMTFRGQPMPVELSGMGLHGDYVGRCDDWPWPKE